MPNNQTEAGPATFFPTQAEGVKALLKSKVFLMKLTATHEPPGDVGGLQGGALSG
jgi:hypothetical protein